MTQIDRCRRFQNRSILIVGASSGIGAAVARAVAAEGGHVIGLARRSDALAEVIGSLPESGHLGFSVDATDAKAVAHVFAQLPPDASTVQGVVFCAGMHALRPVRVASAEHYFDMFRQNVFSVTNFLPPLVRVLGKGASLVLVSSAARFRGGKAATAYAAAKDSVAGLSRALACELAPHARVNSISPGVVRTAATEKFLRTVGSNAAAEIEKRHLLGLGRPDQVASAVTFLLSDDSSWITGIDVPVDGGFSIQA